MRTLKWKMTEQTIFVTHLIITVQLYYYLKTRLSKFGQIVCKFIGKSNERIFCKLNKSEILRLYSIVGVTMETTKTSNFTGQSKFFISIFFTCQVSACELQPFSCHGLVNDIYSETAKTVFSHLKHFIRACPRCYDSFFCFFTSKFAKLKI